MGRHIPSLTLSTLWFVACGGVWWRVDRSDEEGTLLGHGEVNMLLLSTHSQHGTDRDGLD